MVAAVAGTVAQQGLAALAPPDPGAELTTDREGKRRLKAKTIQMREGKAAPITIGVRNGYPRRRKVGRRRWEIS